MKKNTSVFNNDTISNTHYVIIKKIYKILIFYLQKNNKYILCHKKIKLIKLLSHKKNIINIIKY